MNKNDLLQNTCNYKYIANTTYILQTLSLIKRMMRQKVKHLATIYA